MYIYERGSKGQVIYRDASSFKILFMSYISMFKNYLYISALAPKRTGSHNLDREATASHRGDLQYT